MPINLNALLRYKTIDRCLRNTFRPATIDVLIEKCSEALTEKNGVHTGISERTIREDLRVLRSDTLEFNAPIICENGVYSYADPDFELFKTEVKNKKLLREIQSFLVDVYDEIGDNRAYFILKNLSKITEDELPNTIQPTRHSEPMLAEELSILNEDDLFASVSLPEPEELPKIQFQLAYSQPPKPKFNWESVFDLL